MDPFEAVALTEISHICMVDSVASNVITGESLLCTGIREFGNLGPIFVGYDRLF